MKKILCFTLAILLLLSQAVFIVSAETETALENGDRNVLFSNGYRGFCLDSTKTGAYAGDSFVTADASNAQSNKDNSNISQLLKVLFTQCFEDIFEADGNGSYIVKDTNKVQAVVWHLTDGYYIWGEQKTLLNKAMDYSGNDIPDNDYTLTLSTGEVVTFDFMVMSLDIKIIFLILRLFMCYLICKIIRCV